MPELPEVETIRRQLNRILPGKKIKQVDVLLPKMVKVPAFSFRRRVVGATFLKIHRRAKLILMDITTGWTIVIHLKMTGQLIWQGSTGRSVVGGHPIPGGLDNLPNTFSHVIFHTSSGVLYFNDQRQFGHIKLVRTKELKDWLLAQGYGPEPLEAAFRLTKFLAILERHRVKKIKPVLMDQTVIAGIGNIYADEVLHYARVRPDRRVMTLGPKERRDLYTGIRHVMKLSLKYNGTTADAYRTATGAQGRFLSFLRVYGRDRQPCRRCRSTIVKTVLAGRGTHYCPNCQR